MKGLICGQIIKRSIGFIIMTGIAILSVVSCRHKELCLQHPHKTSLRIEFDWTKCPEKVRPPEARRPHMYVFFYPVDNTGTHFWREISPKGTVMDIPDGVYNIICYNSNSETLRPIGKDNFDTHQAFTTDKVGILAGADGVGNLTTSERAKDTENEDVVMCVDELWGCTAVNVSIGDDKVSYTCYPEGDYSKPSDVYNDERVLTLYPTNLVCHYEYEVKHVINATNVTNVCATISGMSGHYRFADGSIANETVILPLSTRVVKSEDVDTEASFKGEFLTFGHHESNEKAHKMVFYLWRSFGEEVKLEKSPDFDVTDQVDTAQDKWNVRIVIDTLELEQGPPTTDSGSPFEVVVGDYIDVNIDIPLG